MSTREHNGETIEFGTAGYTMDHVFVLYDRASNTVWYPSDDALEGVGGERLGDSVPFIDKPGPTPLSAWIGEHPESTVLLPTEADFRYLNRPFLGVRGLEENEGGGLVVRNLVEDGPAESSGIQVGDVLLQIGDVKLEARSSLREAMEGRVAGDTVAIVVLRNGKESSVDVTLGRRQ